MLSCPALGVALIVVEAHPVTDHPAGVLQALEPSRCTHWSVSVRIARSTMPFCSIGDEAVPWRQRLLSATVIRSRVCLFVDLSLNDYNLDSMVPRGQATHAAISSSPPLLECLVDLALSPASRRAQKERSIFCSRRSGLRPGPVQGATRIAQRAARVRACANQPRDRICQGSARPTRAQAP